MDFPNGQSFHFFVRRDVGAFSNRRIVSPGHVNPDLIGERNTEEADTGAEAEPGGEQDTETSTEVTAVATTETPKKPPLFIRMIAAASKYAVRLY